MKNLMTVVIFILLLTSVFTTAVAQSSTLKPFMGVTISDTMPTSIRKQYKLKDNEGVRVLAISENSSAQKAGIQVKDVLFKLNDSIIRSTPQFIALVESYKVGATIIFTLYRNGKKKVQPVVLKYRIST